jgi:hypothetical protein
MPMPTFPLVRLNHFQTELHACHTRRADALLSFTDGGDMRSRPLPAASPAAGVTSTLKLNKPTVQRPRRLAIHR